MTDSRLKDPILIRFDTEPPSADQYASLFETTGWNEIYQLAPHELHRAICNSWYVISAYHGERLVGIGRLVTDQVVHAMVYELIVLPGYQNQGIGGEILERLVQQCQLHGIREIQLFCARGKRSFYEKRGFDARADEAPGMQYRRRLEHE